MSHGENIWSGRSIITSHNQFVPQNKKKFMNDVLNGGTDEIRDSITNIHGGSR